MAQVELALNAADPLTPLSRLIVFAKQDKRLYLKDSSGQTNKVTLAEDLVPYQLKSNALTALASGEANTLAYYSAVDTISLTPLSEDGRNLIGASLAEQREILGLALSNSVSLNQANTFTEPQTFQKGLVVSGEVRELFAVTNITGTYTVNLALSTIFDLTLIGNCELVFPEPLPGRQFTLILNQDNQGNRTVAWPSNCRWDEHTVPNLSTAASTTSTFTFLAVGSVWLSYLTGLKFTR